jgi:hypothetical protein
LGIKAAIDDRARSGDVGGTGRMRQRGRKDESSAPQERVHRGHVRFPLCATSYSVSLAKKVEWGES